MSHNSFVVSGPGELTPEERKRAARANEICQRVCEECGIKVSSWMDFEAWKSYVRGDIEDRELSEQAKKELEGLTKAFGKYAVLSEGEPQSLREYSFERKRAALANKMYKKICRDMGLPPCLFSDFLTWSDYVRGRISEAEFYERATAEAETMRETAEAEAT